MVTVTVLIWMSKNSGCFHESLKIAASGPSLETPIGALSNNNAAVEAIGQTPSLYHLAGLPQIRRNTGMVHGDPS